MVGGERKVQKIPGPMSYQGESADAGSRKSSRSRSGSDKLAETIKRKGINKGWCLGVQREGVKLV